MDNEEIVKRQLEAIRRGENIPGTTNITSSNNKTEEKTAEEWFDMGYKTSDPKYKIEYYDRTLKLNPKHVDAWNNKGVALDNVGKYEDAIKCYDDAIRLNPKYSRAWNNKGAALENLGKHEDAIKCYDESLKLDSKYDRAKKNRNSALEKLRLQKDANKWFQLGYNSNNPRDQIEYYDEVLKLDPKNDAAWNNKGLALDNVGKYEDAIKCYDKALELNKTAIRYNNKGLALDHLGKYEDAIKCYDDALKLDPKHEYANKNRLSVLEKLKNSKSIIVDESDPLHDAAYPDIDRIAFYQVEFAVLNKMVAGLSNDNDIAASLKLPNKTVNIVKGWIRQIVAIKLKKSKVTDEEIIDWYTRSIDRKYIYPDARIELILRLKKCGMIFDDLIVLDMFIGYKSEQHLLPSFMTSIMSEKEIGNLFLHENDSLEQKRILIDSILISKTGVGFQFWCIMFSDLITRGILMSYVGKFPELFLLLLKNPKKLHIPEDNLKLYRSIYSQRQDNPVIKNLLETAKNLGIPFEKPTVGINNRIDNFIKGYNAGKKLVDIGELMSDIINSGLRFLESQNE